MKEIMTRAWAIYRTMIVPRIRTATGSVSSHRAVFARCLRMAWAMIRPVTIATKPYDAVGAGIALYGSD